MSIAVQIEPVTSEKIARKIRRRLLPFLFLLYVIAFLDRINIGFAALTMNREIGITAQQFGLIAGIFFLGYSTFEIPSNLLLHRLGARLWIARILIVWGIVAALTGFVRTVPQLCVARFLLGLAEAGYFPGIVLYLTYWFRQRDLAKAIALFMTALPVSSVLGAPLSGVILDHIHWLGMSSWRWLLILEGLPAILCGGLVYFLLPSRPTEARFLSEPEKEWVMAELAREKEAKGRKLSALQALANGRVWHMAAAQFFFAIAMYALSFWMPQVVASLAGGDSETRIGLLVMIPCLVAVIVMVFISDSSDRKGERRYHTALPMIFAGLALLSLGSTRSLFLGLLLLSCAALGTYGSLGPFWSIPSEFLTGYSAAAGIALVNAIANLGGFVGPFMIGAINKQSGSFYGGLAVAGGAILLSAFLILLLPKAAPPEKTLSAAAT
jgi:ACS family tartrate transporter-like MFS transporter